MNVAVFVQSGWVSWRLNRGVNHADARAFVDPIEVRVKLAVAVTNDEFWALAKWRDVAKWLGCPLRRRQPDETRALAGHRVTVAAQKKLKTREYCCPQNGGTGDGNSRRDAPSHAARHRNRAV